MAQAIPAPLAGSRLAYLDWLRFFVVLSLAPFHAALSYTGMGVVYVYDTPVRDILLSGVSLANAGPYAMRLFTIFMDNWFMHLLFLVSGIGVAASLRKRNAGEFVGERANRLMLPLLFGTLCVIPVQAWLRALSFGRFSGGFFSFYPHFFNGINTGPASKGNLDYGQLWFLLYLFVFSVLALPLFLMVKRRAESSRILAAVRRLARGGLILLPAIWTGLLEGAFRPGWPGFQNLVNDWANFSVYLSFFLFGYAAGSARELLAAAERNRLAALLMGVLAFVARLGVYRLFTVPPGYSGANIATHAFRGVAAWGLVVAAIGYGSRYLNRPSRALDAARDMAFPLYVLHFVPVCAATYLLLGSGLGVWTRWGIAVAASWGTVALFTWLAGFVPVLREFFGLRRDDRREHRSACCQGSYLQPDDRVVAACQGKDDVDQVRAYEDVEGRPVVAERERRKHPSAPCSQVDSDLPGAVKESVERSLRFESTLSLITEICQSIQRNVALCRVLFSKHGDGAFLQRIMYLARDKSIALWKRAATKKDAVQMSWLYAYFANGCVAVIQEWVQSGAVESPEEIAHFIDTVSSRGLKAFVR